MRTIVHMALVGVLLLAGCAAVGPPTVTRDRFDYVSAISESWKRQMLLNMLKVRYTDAPVFMDVASVISSYSLEGEVRLFGEYAPPGRGDTVAEAAVGKAHCAAREENHDGARREGSAWKHTPALRATPLERGLG